MDNPTRKRFLAESLFLALSVTFLPACLLHRHRHSDLAGPVNPGDQPDKILYGKATNEIEHGRFDVGRLTLQTLINTYPDSEYLAKAKLAIADSYYKEGGVSGLTQAEEEYKDFITFFPTAPEAPEAQFRAGMAHFRLMGKVDRDRTEAKLAEAELREFLLKYPDSPLRPRVKVRFREVQEVLAQGDYRIARFYFMKGSNRAARSRFEEIVNQYPNFSEADNALWYLGQTLERLKQSNAAAPYYAQIVTDHPLSSLVGDAKARLTALHQPIPRPTRAMLARARADAAYRQRRDPFERLGGMFSSSPDTSATRHGPVRLGGPRPGAVEVATTPGGATTSGNSIVVQPLSDSSSSSGQKLSSKPAGNGEASKTTGTVQRDSDTSKTEVSPATPSSDNSSDSPPPTKKRGRKHFFKKLVKPF